MKIKIYPVIFLLLGCGTPEFDKEDNFAKNNVIEVVEKFYEFTREGKNLSYESRSFILKNGKTDSVYIVFHRAEGKNTLNMKYHYRSQVEPDSVTMLYSYPDGTKIPAMNYYFYDWAGVLQSMHDYGVYNGQKTLSRITKYEYSEGGKVETITEKDMPSGDIRVKRVNTYDGSKKLLTSESTIFGNGIHKMKTGNREYDDEGRIIYLQSENSNGMKNEHRYVYLGNGLLDSYCILSGKDTVSKHIFSYKYR